MDFFLIIVLQKENTEHLFVQETFFLYICKYNFSIVRNIHRADINICFFKFRHKFLLKDDDQERILKHTNDYVVRKIKDPQSGKDYLEMWGYLSDNVFVTMRSHLDSIRESANLANQFLIYLGIFGFFFRWYFGVDFFP